MIKAQQVLGSTFEKSNLITAPSKNEYYPLTHKIPNELQIIRTITISMKIISESTWKIQFGLRFKKP